MIAPGRRRGQPLIALVGIVVVWIAMRAVLLTAPGQAPAVGGAGQISLARVATRPDPIPPPSDPIIAGPAARLPDPVTHFGLARVDLHPPSASRSPPVRAAPIGPGIVPPDTHPTGRAPPPLRPQFPATAPFSTAPFSTAARQPLVPLAREASRWSADGWVLLRNGSRAGRGATLGGAAPSSYGASQAGAVLRYRLAPGDRHRPTIYARASAALNGSRQRDLAAGLSARPLAALPVVLNGELRVTEDRFSRRTRPAAFAYTELPPASLPGGWQGETYVQAGYVAGRGATAFVDGLLRVDRPAGGRLRVGAGVWGGAQRDAARLDVGPSATLGVSLGPTASARVGLDWRFRVAGNAAPASGPALTIAAGF